MLIFGASNNCSCWSHLVSNRFSLYIAGIAYNFNQDMASEFRHANWLKPLMQVTFLMLKVLNQEETPFLYSVVFGEGVVNDATSIVLYNAVQSLDLSNIDALTALKLLGTFLYLFFTSTILGVVVSYRFFG